MAFFFLSQKRSETKAPVMKKSAAVAKAFNPDEEVDNYLNMIFF